MNEVSQKIEELRIVAPPCYALYKILQDLTTLEPDEIPSALEAGLMGKDLINELNAKIYKAFYEVRIDQNLWRATETDHDAAFFC